MIVAIDTETELIDPLAVDLDYVPRLVCCSVAIAGEGSTQLWHRNTPNARERIAARIDDPANLLIFHNAVFDVATVLKWIGRPLEAAAALYRAGRIRCTMIRAQMLSSSYGLGHKEFNLGAAARHYAPEHAGVINKADEWRLKYGTLIDVPLARWPAEAIRYAMRDAAVTLAIYQMQESVRIDQRDFDVLQDESRQAYAHWTLYQHEIHGLRTDQTQWHTIDREIAGKIDKARATMLEHDLLRPKYKRPRPNGEPMPYVRNTKLAMAMAEQAGSAAYTDTGKISLNKDALSQLQLPEDHPLRAYQDYVSLIGIRERTLAPLRAPVVRTSYVPFVDTGRTSSRRPNLQNLPRSGGFREILVPRPGNVFVISDFTGAELVTWSQACIDMFGDCPMADALRNGRDVHAELACDILGVSEYDGKNHEHKDARQLAKIPHFGYIGGMGASRLVDYARASFDRIISEDQAFELKQIWDWKWNGQRYLDAVSRTENFDGTYTIVLKRSGRVRRGCTFTEACNTRFQGPASDAAKQASIDLYEARLDRTSVLWQTRQVLFVHDEFVTECPRSIADQVKAEQERIMIAAFRRFTPDVPVRVDSHIVERYCKL